MITIKSKRRVETLPDGSWKKIGRPYWEIVGLDGQFNTAKEAAIVASSYAKMIGMDLDPYAKHFLPTEI